MEVSKKRHLVKAITWRLIASTISFIIAYFITGDLTTGFVVGGVDTIIKFIGYYLHERIWYRVGYGLFKKDDKKTS